MDRMKVIDLVEMLGIAKAVDQLKKIKYCSLFWVCF